MAGHLVSTHSLHFNGNCQTAYAVPAVLSGKQSMRPSGSVGHCLGTSVASVGV